MAIIKCKMCGGDLELIKGVTVAECEYCGSKQTVPTADNDKKMALFGRASRLRMACEFDKAAGVYEAIVADFPEEAEAYWGLVLCKFGIEYVDDPATGKKIPTCHRSSFVSVLKDNDFDQACENADIVARKVYRDEAKVIEDIRKGIIEVAGNEEPYDIFICYKETDENGERTIDSVLAQDVYDALTARNYRVFFSRITLEDKLGQEYEPYIFAALNSAKVMLAFGTDYEYYNAVWVKNEWSRYLHLMTKDKGKHLIPCYKGIDPYDMPIEFAKLQAQDMGKLGAMQDLLRGIEKMLPKGVKDAPVAEQVIQSGGPNVESLLRRGQMFLEDENWEKANEYFDRVLDIHPENGDAYAGKLCAGLMYKHIRDIAEDADRWGNDMLASDSIDVVEVEALLKQGEKIKAIKKYREITGCELVEAKEAVERMGSDKCIQFNGQVLHLNLLGKNDIGNYEKVLRYGSKQLKAEIAKYIHTAQEKAAENRRAQNYKIACEAMETANCIKDFEYAAERFSTAAGYLDADERQRTCMAKAKQMREEERQVELAHKEELYTQALAQERNAKTIMDYAGTAEMFCALGDYKDSHTHYERCTGEADRLNAAEKAEQERREEEERALADKLAAERRAERDRQAAIAAKERAAKAKRNKTVGIVAGVIMAIGIAATAIITQIVIPGNNYAAATDLLADGKYEEAIAAFESLGDYKDSIEKVAICKEFIKNDAIQNCSIGDTIIFGSYEQDNLTDDKEEIEWLVLDKDEGKIFVISKYGLSCNGEIANPDWESGLLRSWLNGEFLNSAFSNDEIERIVPISIITDGPNGETTTTDRIFLLSIDEVEKYFPSIADRKVTSTKFVAHGYDTVTDNGASWWWLRSAHPDHDMKYAAGVKWDGSIVSLGRTDGVIRPAMWISLGD